MRLLCIIYHISAKWLELGELQGKMSALSWCDLLHMHGYVEVQPSYLCLNFLKSSLLMTSLSSNIPNEKVQK